ncbi:FAD-binding and (Fe-S)-binding domain-containing protein [Pseudarthrobacter sp. J75]|uniref:FAD-binding and (Fe-S)-binding domain-containing protein n=1 Tax=unclassified Pseudarthrobacter TaxID=2647000 RepID=UPI002E809C6A|nr:MULTISPECIES: FAD-binding and (Fe-S)-binding domain-containing protein [unclassified Pseudarthrobacter]MEE2524438.1 FAD-binding and (Fe-S)-binding domain-containing protein [Pseudarthrobacter sp. J47]MEE2529869.1 FAD-binding and (Fe-S)-binding domain-containing protein [Pseudarthrobacter sp. J75]
MAPFRNAVQDPAQVKTRAIDLHANAHDASHFLLVPQAVVTAGSADEVGRLLRASAAQGVPLTLRSGGTSLSGQAVSDGVLVDVRRNFRDIEVLDGGTRVRVQPGVTVRALNARLARYGRKFGPDPASEAACTIGGVIANNSSGMNCGTVDNTYRTLESLTVVLPSGTVIDTGDPDADRKLRSLEPELYEGLSRLAGRVRGNQDSVNRIRQQFSMKNTMGYGLNSLLDFRDPVDIMAHLIVGSEGTLGFVAEAVFRTIPRLPHAAAGLLVFPDLEAANAALPALVETGAATIELLDALSLKVGQGLKGTPAVVQDLAVQDHAALLVEYSAGSREHLEELQAGGASVLPGLGLSAPARFTGDARERGQLWHLRKGLYASVAGARPQGTTALLEDIVVPVPVLGRTCRELIRLFDKYAYSNSVIFGHAKDGNVHFMLTDGFATAAELERYSAFTEDMVEVVLAEGGSLKAEHGTGRVMAPYVRRQYGDELYSVMRSIKALFDPAGMLNPGVVMDDDPTAHLRHIKTAPPVAEEVDRCVSCGYCEPVCPSKDITLTPRQRIVTLRAIEAARLAGNAELVRELEKDYDYESVDTCAVDGMCQTACPVDINTGLLVKRLRKSDAGPVANAAWNTAARHWDGVTRGASLALTVVDKVPPALVTPPNKAARAVLGKDTVPLYSPELPAGGSVRKRPTPEGSVDAVYFPACVGTMFGPAEAAPGTAGRGVQYSFEQLAARAGLALLVPEGIDGLCCGTPWSSKGMAAGQATMREKTLAALREATRDGELPIVCDASSCTEGLHQAVESEEPVPGRRALRIVDAVDFAAERILPLLPGHGKLERLALHPTCSSTRLGLNDALQAVAGAVAETVEVPESWGCCAFAGDRGMLHPELTASATARQAAEVVAMEAPAHASCNRTCELGMTRATGAQYRHVLELLEEVTG